MVLALGRLQPRSSVPGLWSAAGAKVNAVYGSKDETLGHYLCAHNVGEVKWLLHDGHEGFPKVCGNKHVGHGQQAVRSESLN